VLALLGRIVDPVGHMRTGASGFKTLEFISRCLFLAAFGYIPAMIVLRTMIAIVRAWRRRTPARPPT
jgi:hypothetical protein